MMTEQVSFSSRQEDPATGRIPIHLITGFLGNGKVLARLRRLAACAGSHADRRTRITFITRSIGGGDLMAVLRTCTATTVGA